MIVSRSRKGSRNDFRFIALSGPARPTLPEGNAVADFVAAFARRWTIIRISTVATPRSGERSYQGKHEPKIRYGVDQRESELRLTMTKSLLRHVLSRLQRPRQRYFHPEYFESPETA